MGRNGQSGAAAGLRASGGCGFRSAVSRGSRRAPWLGPASRQTGRAAASRGEHHVPYKVQTNELGLVRCIEVASHRVPDPSLQFFDGIAFGDDAVQGRSCYVTTLVGLFDIEQDSVSMHYSGWQWGIGTRRLESIICGRPAAGRHAAGSTPATGAGSPRRARDGVAFAGRAVEVRVDLVLPGEAAALEHIRITAALAEQQRALLEQVVVATAGRRDAEHSSMKCCCAPCSSFSPWAGPPGLQRAMKSAMRRAA